MTKSYRLFTEYPRKIASSLLASNFSRFSLSLKMKHLLPNTRKYFTFGFVSFHISYDVFFVPAWKKILFLMWHEIFTASAQNFYGMSLLRSITLAISWITQFFLSTTPFCCGVFRAKNSFLIPCSLQNASNLTFLNSFPWSLLILTMGTPFSFWSFLHSLFIFLHASDFSLRNSIQEYLEKSSTTTMVYLFPLMFSVLVGPIRSTWSNSNGRDVATTFTLGWIDLVRFPNWHGPQIFFSIFPKFSNQSRLQVLRLLPFACNWHVQNVGAITQVD